MATEKTTKAKKGKATPSRLRKLLEFDRKLPELLPDVVIGFDEVGRGCLAGPVVAAAVRLPAIEPRSRLSRALSMLNDSKALLPKYREQLAAIIQECSQYAICEASVEEINELNILHASLLAMKRCRQALRSIPRAVLLVDGNMPIPGVSDPQITVVKGDGRSASIAAASIIAKVYRDAMMARLSVFFPDYLWHSNKGYRSRDHWAAIDRLGVTPWHRNAFVHGPREVDAADEVEADQLAFLDALEIAPRGAPASSLLGIEETPASSDDAAEGVSNAAVLHQRLTPETDPQGVVINSTIVDATTGDGHVVLSETIIDAS